MAGKGDLINLSGSTGTATINAFSFGATRIASPDTILATNNADSVFGGDGDRIGTGNGSVVGGTHQWIARRYRRRVGGRVRQQRHGVLDDLRHGSGTATRGTVAGTSSAQVTVGGFNTATDFLFYQNENADDERRDRRDLAGDDRRRHASTIITLPDGTVMTLVGVTQAQLQSALGAGTLFKP